MSWLGYLNMFVCQFLFFRICRFLDKDDPKGRQTYWGILFPIIPFTGWRCDYHPRWHFNIKIYKLKKKWYPYAKNKNTGEK